MIKFRKAWLITLFVVSFFCSLIINIPAWTVGSLISHYSNGRLTTVNEHGSFWHGDALLIAFDTNQKSIVPMLNIGWDIKLGLKKFILINFNISHQPIAQVAITSKGLQIDQVNLALSLDQLSMFLGNLPSLGLSGNAQINASSLTFAKVHSGTVNLHFEDVGSSLAPLNPLGSYSVILDLASSSISVTSDQGDLLNITGTGSFYGLILNARVVNDKKAKFLQFMTMMGLPQADGSYQLKVF